MLLKYYAAATATLLAGVFGYTLWYHAVVRQSSWINALIVSAVLACATATTAHEMGVRFAAWSGAAVVAAVALGSACAGGVSFYLGNGEVNQTYAFHALLSPLIFCNAGYLLGLAVHRLGTRNRR